jgi:hypothetical protein
MARGVGGKSPSKVQSYLKGASYPARKADLIRTAQANSASPEVMGVLEALVDQEFGGPQDVMKAYSAERKEERHA